MKKYLLLFFFVLFISYIHSQVKTNNIPLKSESIINHKISNITGSSLIPSGIKDGVNSVLAFLFVEFEDNTFPPAGWQLEYTGTKFWFLDSLCSGYGIGSKSAKFESYNAIPGTTQSLISTVFISAVSGDSLKFDNAYAPYSASGAPDDQLEIDNSTDGGSTWNTLVLFHGGSAGQLVSAPPTSAYFIPTASQWKSQNYALPVGTNRLKFKAISGYGNNIYLDNIKVGSQPANDAGVVTIDMAASYQFVKVVPKVTVRNFGTAVNTFNINMTISPGGYSSIKTVTNLAPSAFIQVTFDDWLPAIGTYNVKVSTQLPGDGNPANDTSSAYITVSNTGWISGYNNTIPTFLGSGCATIYNNVPLFFSLGGNTASTLGVEVNKYNINSNSWSACALIPMQRVVMASAASMGKVFSIGGAENPSNPDYKNTIYIYDIASNTWSLSTTTLPSVMGWCKAAVYQDSLIYIVGGFDGGIPLSQVLLYNINNNTIRSCTSMPFALFSGAMAVTDSSIVYVGGCGTQDQLYNSTLVGSINQTDRSKITWTNKTPYPPGNRFRWDAGSWINNSIIVTGGSSTLDWYSTPDCYVYNVGTDTWKQMINKPTPILGASASSIKLSNGGWRFIVASGYGVANSDSKNEIFYNNDNVTSVKVENNTASTYYLEQNYPNPFNPTTIIKYSVPQDGYVKLTVYNILGKEISTLVNNWQRSGSYNVVFNANNLSSGVYFYRIESGSFSSTKKLTLIK